MTTLRLTELSLSSSLWQKLVNNIPLCRVTSRNIIFPPIKYNYIFIIYVTKKWLCLMGEHRNAWWRKLEYFLKCNSITGWIFTKIVADNQSRVTNRYRHLKRDILKWNANVYFDKQSLDDNLPSKFANIKIKNTSLGSKFSHKCWYGCCYVHNQVIVMLVGEK